MFCNRVLQSGRFWHGRCPASFRYREHTWADYPETRTGENARVNDIEQMNQTIEQMNQTIKQVMQPTKHLFEYVLSQALRFIQQNQRLRERER